MVPTQLLLSCREIEFGEASQNVLAENENAHSESIDSGCVRFAYLIQYEIIPGFPLQTETNRYDMQRCIPLPIC